MFAFWTVAAAVPSTSPTCPADPAECVRLGDEAATRKLHELARARWKQACQPGDPRECGPLAAVDAPAAALVVAEAEHRCVGGEALACLGLGELAASRPRNPLRDGVRGLQFLEAACDLGSGPGCLAAGRILAEGREGIDRDAVRATAAFEAGCEAADAEACEALAFRRIDGNPGDPDPGGALEALGRACTAERGTACRTLGDWLARGRGTSVNRDRAAHAYAEGCRHGDDDACARAVRWFQEEGVQGDGLREILGARCTDDRLVACGQLVAVGGTVGRKVRKDPLPEACAAGHRPSCDLAAAAAEGWLKAQLTLEAARLLAEEVEVLAVEAGPAAGVPAARDLEACVRERTAELAALGGRATFAPEGVASADWLARELAEGGLEVNRQAVLLPRARTVVVVGDRRFPAQAAPGSAGGIVEGPVKVLPGPATPADLAARGDAVALAWVTGSAAESVPRIQAPIPLLAVSPAAAEALRAAGRAVVAAAPEGQAARADNVLGLLPGKGALAGETVVTSAHFDGFGIDEDGVVKPAADDNGSGTTALLCATGPVAAALAGLESHRAVVFAAFTGEEIGLLGSRAYVGMPLRPLSSTVADLNVDMIGRSATLLDVRAYPPAFASRIAGPAAAVGMSARHEDEPAGSSDHLPFALAGVPSLQLFTGIHGDYHRATDTADRIDVVGVARITAAASAAVIDLATGAPPPPPTDPCTELVDTEVGLGWDVPIFDGPRHLPVRCVRRGSAADAAGAQPGDLVLKAPVGWPLTRLELPVRRGQGCFVLRVDAPAEPVPCERVL